MNLCLQSLDIRSINGVSPYFLTITLGKTKLEELQEAIISLGERNVTAQDLVSFESALKLQKYDNFIPTNLLRQAFAVDYLDVEELRTIVSKW